MKRLYYGIGMTYSDEVLNALGVMNHGEYVRTIERYIRTFERSNIR